MSGTKTNEPDHVRQASVLIVGRVIATLSDALVPMILVRLLAQGDVGVLVTILLAYSTLALVLTAGFPATLMYYLPTRDRAGRRAVALRTTAVTFGLGAAASLLMAGIGLLGYVRPTWVAHLAGGTDVGAEGVLYFLGLALYPLGEMPSRLLQNLLVVEQRADGAMSFGVFKSLGTTLATIVPLLLGGSLWSVALSLSAFGLVQGALVLWVIRSLYLGAGPAEAGVTVKELFRFSFPIGLTDIIGFLNSAFDRYLIVLTFPAAMVAVYTMGAWQIPIITSIPYMVGTVYTPTYTRMLAEGRAEEAIGTWRASIHKVSLLVVPLTAVFLVGSEETMELLFTSSYSGAATIFRWYTVFTLGRVAAFGAVLVAAGKPDYVVRAALWSLLSNVVLSIPLLHVVGFQGPAIATAIAFVPMVASYCWYIAKATDLRFRAIFPLAAYLRVIAVAIVPCALATAFKLGVTLPTGAKLGLEALILLVSFAIVGTLVGEITREDWRTLLGLVKRRVSAG